MCNNKVFCSAVLTTLIFYILIKTLTHRAPESIIFDAVRCAEATQSPVFTCVAASNATSIIVRGVIDDVRQLPLLPDADDAIEDPLRAVLAIVANGTAATISSSGNALFHSMARCLRLIAMSREMREVRHHRLSTTNC